MLIAAADQNGTPASVVMAILFENSRGGFGWTSAPPNRDWPREITWHDVTTLTR